MQGQDDDARATRLRSKDREVGGCAYLEPMSGAALFLLRRRRPLPPPFVDAGLSSPSSPSSSESLNPICLSFFFFFAIIIKIKRKCTSNNSSSSKKSKNSSSSGSGSGGGSGSNLLTRWNGAAQTRSNPRRTSSCWS